MLAVFFLYIFGSFLYILIGAYTDICLGECIVIGEIGSDM